MAASQDWNLLALLAGGTGVTDERLRPDTVLETAGEHVADIVMEGVGPAPLGPGAG
jgi:hypothetical protein